METERIHIHQVFKGVLFGTDEDLAFKKVYLQMDWLAYWVMQSGLEETMDFTEDEDGMTNRSVTLTIRKIPTVEFAGNGGSIVSLGQNYGVAGDGIVEQKLTQDFYFAISYGQLVDLARVLEEAGDLQDLVSIGTGRTAAYKRLSLRHPDVAEPIGEKIRELPIDLFAQWITGANVEGTKAIIADHMFFTLEDLGGTEGVARWLAVAAQYRSALSSVMFCRYSKTMVVTDRLLNCAAALEAYDREKHNDGKTYVERIKRCIRGVGAIFRDLVGDTEAWAKELKENRNAVAHHNVRIDGATTGHFFMSESAYWLFVLALLKDAGAPDAVFDRIRAHGDFRWVRRGVAAVLHPPGPALGGS